MEPLSVSLLWLAVGALFVALEAFGISGIGFLFAGLAALVTGTVIEAGWVGEAEYLAQFAWFFGFTVLWGIVLWKPLRAFQKGRKNGGYSNMIGDTVIVGDAGVQKSEPGNVRWSGTIMQAQLAPDCAAGALTVGSKARIVDVKGATLIIEPL